MSSEAQLGIKIAAENLASPALKEVTEHSSGLGKALERVGTIWEGIELHELSDKFMESIKEGIESVSTLGQATYRLSEQTGMATEVSSAWIEAFNKFGVSADDASKSLGIFSKNLANGTSKTFNDSLAEMGVEIKDADGNLRPMNDVLLDVADKFKEMPDGAQKTADAMNMFGKSGKDLLPVLDEGREGLQEAMDTAAKYGLTLTGANVEAVRQFGFAHKELDAAMEGVTVQLGAALMPALAKGMELISGVAGEIASGAVPQFKAFGEAINQALDGDLMGALETMQPALASMLPGIEEQLGKWAEAFLDFIGPIIPPLLGALADLVGQMLEWLGSKLPDIMDQLSQWGQMFVDWVGPRIPPLLIELGKLLGQLWDWIQAQTPGILEQLGHWGLQFIAWIAPMIPPFLVEMLKVDLAIIKWVGEQATKLGAALVTEWIPAFLSWIQTDLLPKIPPAFGAMLDAIGTWLSETAVPWVEGKMGDFASSMVTAVGNGFSALGGVLNTKLHDALNAIHADVGPFHLSAGGFSIDAPQMPSISLPTIGGGGGGQMGGSSLTPSGNGTIPQVVGGMLTQAGLTADQIAAFCGPIAAEAIGDGLGKAVNISTLFQDAVSSGWSSANGMGGTGDFTSLLNKMGIQSRIGGLSDAISALAAGTPVAISTAGHYFEATGYNAQTGQFNVGNSGLAYRNGAAQLTAAQMNSLGGGINGYVIPQRQMGGDALSAGMGTAMGTAATGAVTIQVTGNTMLGDDFTMVRRLAQLLKPELDRLVSGPA